MTKTEAVGLMERAGGHAYLTPDGAQKIADAFGVRITMQHVTANTGEPKGLMIDDVGPNTPVEGYSVYDLAERIAESLDGPELPRFYRMMHGRGSRSDCACETIRAHLDAG